jgi:8-oxo-dGTP pyrophosphatase MutT (NUDIX family)
MPNIVRARKQGELKIIPNGEPEIISRGRIGALVHYPVLEDQGRGYIEKIFEKFVRAPGTRIIALKDNKIYLQHEARLEATGDFDWRLPGGKVLDKFSEFEQYISKSIPDKVVKQAALKELQEEAGLTTKNLEIFTKKICGTTVEWDLYYLIAKGVKEHGLDYDNQEGEEVKASNWFTFKEVREMCEQGAIAEGISAAALIQFIAQIKN